MLDHQAFAAIAYASDETLTIDGLLRGEPEEVKSESDIDFCLYAFLTRL